jgi:Family of unknown function (DUF5686)/CarboxypepD_reg-like domain
MSGDRMLIKKTISLVLLLASNMFLHAQENTKGADSAFHAIDSVTRLLNPDKGPDSLKGVVFPGATPNASTPPAEDTGTSDTDTTTAIIYDSTATTTGYTFVGSVTDKSTGVSIPAATIFIPHSSDGAIADADGHFSMHIAYLKVDTLHIEVLGYKPYLIPLKKDVHRYKIQAALEPAANTLNEFVLHAGEDPAVTLMHLVVKHKDENNPNKEDNYRYDTYTRVEADLRHLSEKEMKYVPFLSHYKFAYKNLDTTSEDAPFLPMYLTESMSEYYFRSKPKKQREFITATLAKGVDNQNVSKYMGTLYQNINIYKEFIPVTSLRFVSPINNKCLVYYKYKIIDTEVVQGHRIIRLSFEPRRKGELCFTGTIGIADTSFAVQQFTLNVPRNANVNWVTRLIISQQFELVQDSFWFCTQDKWIADFSAYSDKMLGITVRKNTEFSNIRINDPSIDTVLDNPHWRTDVITEDSSWNRNDQWWAEHRPDTLTMSEKKIYKMVDTIVNMKYTRHLKHFVRFLTEGVVDYGPIQFGPYFYAYSSNSLEGNRFRLSLGTPYKLKNVHFTGYLAYGDLDKMFKYGATGLWVINRSPWQTLYAAYIYDIDHTSNYYNPEYGANIFSSVARKPGIPYKLALTDEKRIEYYKEYYSGFSHRLSLWHRSFYPYAPLPASNIFVDNMGRPSMSVINTEAKLTLRFGYKEKFLEGHYDRRTFGSKYPIPELQIGFGIKGLWGSGYDYQKIRLSVSNYVKVPPLGVLYYTVFAGKYFNTLPYPLLEIHPGNEYYTYNANAFQMMNNYEFLSDKYAGFMLENDIGGGVFNYIPLFKRLRFRQLWTAKGITGSLSDANQALNLSKGYSFRTLQGNPYIELGTGVSNIFRILRIDFVWRVTPKPLPTESKSRYFGIFVSGQVGF